MSSLFTASAEHESAPYIYQIPLLRVAYLCVPADCLAARSVTHLMKGLSARLVLKCAVLLALLFVVGLAKGKEEDYYKVRVNPRPRRNLHSMYVIIQK